MSVSVYFDGFIGNMAENITLYERMTKVETQLDNLVQWQDDLKLEFRSMNSSIQAMIIANDTKYASKRTETIVDNGMWIIVTFVILWVLALLVKKKQ